MKLWSYAYMICKRTRVGDERQCEVQSLPLIHVLTMVRPACRTQQYESIAAPTSFADWL